MPRRWQAWLKPAQPILRAILALTLSLPLSAAYEATQQQPLPAWEDGGTESACKVRFEADPELWLSHTGGSVDHVPAEHFGLAPNARPDLAFSRIHQNEVALSCHMIGGAMWEVFWMDHLGFIACAPASCSPEEVESGVGRSFLIRVAEAPKSAASQFYAMPFSAEEARTIELKAKNKLGAWSELTLDFAIVGVAGCGTTTLFRNLLQHPDIAFTSEEEDWSLRQRNLLPTADYVNNIVEKKRKCMAEGRKLLGRDNPMDFLHRADLAVFTLIPDMKVIVLTCDPVRVFEKWWWGLDSRVFEEDQELPATEWLKLARKTIEQRGGGLFSELPPLLEVFGERFIWVHQSHLRVWERPTFGYILGRLGVQDFDKSKPFSKHHTWTQPMRFCSNQTIVRILKRLFRDDYELSRLLANDAQQPVPRELAEGLSYCDTKRWECGMEYWPRRAVKDQWDSFSGGSLDAPSSPSMVVEAIALAEELARNCSAAGGRLWSVNVSWPDKSGGVIGVCAPRICNSGEVTVGIAPRFLMDGKPGIPFLRPPWIPVPDQDFTDMEITTLAEVAQWSGSIGGDMFFSLEACISPNMLGRVSAIPEALFIDLDDAALPMSHVLPSTSTLEWLNLRVQQEVRRRAESSPTLEVRLLLLGMPESLKIGCMLLLVDKSWLRGRSDIRAELHLESGDIVRGRR